MSQKPYVIDQMISAKAIAARVEELAREITAHFHDTDKLVVVGLLRGSFVFIADLVREIDLPVEVDFLEASSYGNAMESSREVMAADLIISFKVFRERFGSRVVLDPGAMTVDTEYLDGPFKHMKSTWAFRDRPEGGCEVEFFVDFEFRNAILQKVIGVVFNEAMLRIVRAFEDRAKVLYGAGQAR